MLLDDNSRLWEHCNQRITSKESSIIWRWEIGTKLSPTFLTKTLATILNFICQTFTNMFTKSKIKKSQHNTAPMTFGNNFFLHSELLKPWTDYLHQLWAVGYTTSKLPGFLKFAKFHLFFCRFIHYSLLVHYSLQGSCITLVCCSAPERYIE